MLKKELRKSAIDYRTQLSFDEKSNKDTRIFEKVVNLPQFINSDIVLCYYSTNIEVNTLQIINKALEMKKRVALPKCLDKDGKMIFRFINTLDDLQEGYFGIKEPVDDLQEYDFSYSNAICIIPALMVDRNGFRLGYGKGYYDRFLSKFGGFKCVLCYEDNVVNNLPIYEDFDVKCDLCLTDAEVIMQDNHDLFKRPDNEQLETNTFEVNEENFENNSVDDFVLEDKKIEIETKQKKKFKLPFFLRFIVIMAISVLLSLTILISLVDFLGLTFNENPVLEIDIKSGFSTAQIANELKEKGAIKFPLLFRVYSKMIGADGSYQYGVYEVRDSQGYGSLIRTLMQPGETGEVVTVTIPEGYSVKQIAALLEENGVCSQSEFISVVKNAEFDYDFMKYIPSESVYYRFEGYLYPDTYQFFKNSDGQSGESCAKKAVRKMLDQMEIAIDDEFIAKTEVKGYSVHEVLTMASIIELEASGYPDDMAKVSQVFYNRLNWTNQPAMLGSTPTSDYVDSRYDTNKNEGLPPGPLCSPSAAAINAALNPDTSVKEDYFVTDKNMKFYYTSSLDEHNDLIYRLKSEGLWN